MPYHREGPGLHFHEVSTAIERGVPRRPTFISHGTGALLSVLEEKGYRAEGLDAAPNMVHMARRVARKAVIIHDYDGGQSFFTELIERLEGGDFFRFAETGQAHLRETFADLDVIDIGGSKAWYIGRAGSVSVAQLPCG